MTGRSMKEAPDAERQPLTPSLGEDVPAAALSQHNTAEGVWAEIEALYRRINSLIISLAPEERERIAQRFEQAVAEEVAKWWRTVLDKMTPNQVADFFTRVLTSIGYNGLIET